MEAIKNLARDTPSSLICQIVDLTFALEFPELYSQASDKDILEWAGLHHVGK